MTSPAFSLLLDTRQGVAEVMAECPKCGAITTQTLQLAWRAQMVPCSECLTPMPFDDAVLKKSRNQAVYATTTIDRLPQVGGPPTNE